MTSRLDPLHLPVFGNTFLMGVSFALLLSFNPCTVPFLASKCHDRAGKAQSAVVVIISLNTTDALVSLLCFGQGLHSLR